MEKIIVDKDSCIGCGMCVQNNPEYFVFSDEGYAEAIDVEVKSEDKADILNRVDECPGQAIHVEEVKVAEETCNCGEDCKCKEEGHECHCGNDCKCGCKEENKCTVTIDKDSCIGCGMCAGTCPEYFTIGEDGFAETLKSEVTPESKESVNEAAINCPGSAINVEE